MKWKRPICVIALVLCVCSCTERSDEDKPTPVDAATAKSDQAVAVEGAKGTAGIPREHAAARLDGPWQLRGIGNKPLQENAPEIIYTFDRGKGSATTNGSPCGNGFTYTIIDGKITIQGGSEEGLADTGTGDTDLVDAKGNLILPGEKCNPIPHYNCNHGRYYGLVDS